MLADMQAHSRRITTQGRGAPIFKGFPLPANLDDPSCSVLLYGGLFRSRRVASPPR